jgi:putative tryptophan/tyrosine transport system substrate-binding protein
LLGGAAAWPVAARAQPREPVRRISVLLPATADDSRFQTWLAAFLQALALLGRTVGRDVRIDIRWAGGQAGDIRRHAAELAALAPDVILAHGDSTVAPLLQATRTVPIVFPNVFDPVGAGYVDSLARPGGSATGFMGFEYSIGAKWLELLREIAPGVTRVAVLRDPALPSGTGQFGVIQAMGPSLRVETNPVNVRDAGEIERAVAAFVLSPNGGLILTASGLANIHRDLIITLAARHKLPAILLRTLIRRRWRPDLLWARLHQPVPARSWLRRSHPQGREACRPASAGTDEVRAGHQPQDHQGAWPRRAAHAARPRRRGDRVRRREFITLLGGAAAGWPLAAQAQQGERMRRIGVLFNVNADDLGQQNNLVEFVQVLQRAGSTAATCGSTPVGPEAMPPRFADMQKIWSRSRRMSSLQQAMRPWDRCCRRRAPCQSSSTMSPTRSVQASLIAWHGRAAT